MQLKKIDAGNNYVRTSCLFYSTTGVILYYKYKTFPRSKIGLSIKTFSMETRFTNFFFVRC